MSGMIDQRGFARLVEDAWTERTKGELWLTREGVTDTDFDAELRSIVDALGVYARESIETVAAGQSDAHGRELADVTDDELASRVAAALDLVLYGGAR